jgi:hypothetical protein
VIPIRVDRWRGFVARNRMWQWNCDEEEDEKEEEGGKNRELKLLMKKFVEAFIFLCNIRLRIFCLLKLCIRCRGIGEHFVHLGKWPLDHKTY